MGPMPQPQQQQPQQQQQQRSAQADAALMRAASAACDVLQDERADVVREVLHLHPFVTSCAALEHKLSVLPPALHVAALRATSACGVTEHGRGVFIGRIDTALAFAAAEALPHVQGLQCLR